MSMFGKGQLLAASVAVVASTRAVQVPSDALAARQARGCILSTKDNGAVAIPVAKGLSAPNGGPTPRPALPILGHPDDVALPGRPVRFDYQSEDPGTGRLYIAHMHDAHVLVFDTRSGRVVGQVGGTPGVTGVWTVPEVRKIYASVTGLHHVAVIDSDSLRIRATPGPIGFPDGIGYAPLSKRVFVSDESGGGELVIDAVTDKVVGRIPLGGEAGNTKYDDGSGCILVAVQTLDQVVAVDPASMKLVGRYAVAKADHPHGMYVDAKDRLLFVANQGNRTLEVVDLRSMEVSDIVPVGDDPDVLAFDPEWSRLYVATEKGGLWVYHLQGNHLVIDGALDLPHAHTVSVDPSTHRVYLPLEKINGRPILRVFQSVRSAAGSRP
jgi:DNA-binding beta-propeller fold protein YncE